MNCWVVICRTEFSWTAPVFANRRLNTAPALPVGSSENHGRQEPPEQRVPRQEPRNKDINSDRVKYNEERSTRYFPAEISGMNKMNPERIDQLLDVWMADRDRGVMRTAAELCMESPELESELSRRIEVIGRFEKLASGGNQETLGSQGEIDTSHSANRPAPALPRKLTPMPASVGGFVPVEILGEGGMGAVYLAEDRQLGRCVAVKVMKKELAADLDARRRFLREARAMATIEHDNIMTIYAVGEDQETPFLVMPVLKGETLDDRLRRECTLSVAESCRISREIADGLAAAHAHGLIHRDIKPSNIWLEGKQGRVRILDFGLARPATDDQRVTQSGAVLGTPAYMAPEQAAGTDATSRSDLFSLGAVMYRMTTGEQPFAGPNMMATLNNLANKHPEAPRTKRPEIPEELSVLIQRLIAKDPEQRLESAADVRESLQQSFETRTSQATAVVPKTSEKPAVKVSAENAHMKPSSAGRSPGIPRKVIAGGLAGMLLLLTAVVYRIQTDHGTLIVTIDDDQVEAKLNKDGLVIEDAKTGRTWKLTPDKAEPMPSGEYKLPQVEGLLLNVRDDSGTEFKTAEFKIKRGDKITVLVTLATDGTSARKLSNADLKSATPDYAKEREIAEWILSIGGTVRVQFESGKVTTLTSQRAPEEKYVARIIKLTKNSQLTNKDLSRLTELSNLQELALTESQQINDTTAEIISRIQTLKSLDLSSTALTDVGMSNIAKLPQLTGLSIHATRVTDLGIAELAKVPTLRVLKATSCPISIAGLQSLSNLPLTELAVGSGYTKIQMSDLPEIAALFPKLRSFDGRLPGTSATGLSPLASLPDLSELMLRREDVVAGEPHQLASFPALKSLFIWHQKIPITFFKELEQIAKVNHLTLQMCDLDDDAMDQFAKSTTIRQLSLFDWSGSDTELLKLVPMTQLRSLNLRNTKVTEAGAKKFHELRPDVAVTDDFNLPAAATPVVVPRDSCPLDSLDASQIPVQERSSDLPPETVAVLGSSHGKTWGSPFFTTHGNMSYSPDGKWICASDMTNVYLFDAATLNLRKRFAYVSQFLNHRWIAFSSDSRRLYVATQSNPQGSGNSMTDLTSPTLKTTTSGERFGGSYILANSPDDQWVAMDDNQIWWGPIRIGKRNGATGNVSEMRAVF